MPNDHRIKGRVEADGSFGRPRRPALPLRRPLVWAGAAALALIAGNALLGEHGLRSYLGLRAERNRLAEDVGTLEAKRDALQSELQELATDDATLERIAREKYHMHREGETVIEVVGGGEEADGPADASNGDS